MGEARRGQLQPYVRHGLLFERADGLWISTLDRRPIFREGDPYPDLPFESCVFPEEDDYREIDQRYYATWDDACAGHDELVAQYRDVPTQAALF